MPNMSKVAMDKGCAIENNNIWPAHKTQNTYPVVQACFLVFFLLKNGDVKSLFYLDGILISASALEL